MSYVYPIASIVRYLMVSGGIIINRIIQYIPSSLSGNIVSGDKRQMYAVSRNNFGRRGRGRIAPIYCNLWIKIREGHRRESKLGSGGESEDQASWVSEGDHAEVRAGPQTDYWTVS